MKNFKNYFAASLIALLGLPVLATETGPYEIVQRLPLGAVTKWDFTSFDTERQHLFVTRGERVDVVSIPSGKIVGTIENTKGVHGVAIAPNLRLGFTSNGKSNSVTVFDLESLTTKAEVQLNGKNPDIILFEPLSNKVYIFNGASSDFEVIDAQTFKIVGGAKIGGRPEFAVSDGKGKVFFNVEDKSELHTIDVASDQVIAKWPLNGCVGPSGLAIDVKNARLFSSCANGIAVVTDASTGKQVVQFSIGEHPDAVIYDAETQTVLTSAGDGNGTLTVARQDDADHYTVVSKLITAKGAKTMAMNPVSKTVYLPTVISGQFVVLVAARKN